MRVEKLVEIIGADFYAGVPDSQLRALCDYLMDIYGIHQQHHIVAANEGNCVGIAAGYYLATGKVPAVYMQNSGEGNIINPVVSLLNDKVYAIPMIFIVGWRGEPGVKDEPQHIFQGEITMKLLADMGIETFVVGTETTEGELEECMAAFRRLLDKGKDVAFVIRKGAISYDKKVKYQNNYDMSREDAIRCIAKIAGEDPIISTTGKASRELFEIRAFNGQSHTHDFLTVGSMGHGSSIALGAALHKPNVRFWCIDGDGSLLMHMGAMAVIGANNPENVVHIVINNGAHETVGGMPTVALDLDIVGAAKACGYPNAVCVDCIEDLEAALKLAKERNELSMIEIKCSVGSRGDLGRPTTSPIENRDGFMRYLEDLK